MTYSISEHNNNLQILEVRSLLNEIENKEILKEIETLFQRGKNKFIIDLAKLDFMNSVGLNFLISMMTKSKDNGGALALANVSKQVTDLLHMTKLKEFFTISPNLEDAISIVNNN